MCTVEKHIKLQYNQYKIIITYGNVPLHCGWDKLLYGLRSEQVHTAMRTPKYKSDRMTSSEPIDVDVDVDVVDLRAQADELSVGTL